MAATTVAGIIIGLPTLRLRGDYIAIVTLAFGEIIGRIAINGDEIKGFGTELTAGRQGITPVDKIDLPFVDRFTSLELRPWFYVALGLVFIVLFVNFRLRDSRLGRAWIALREDEVAASSMGIPMVKTKLMAYGTGAAFGGLSGAFLASYLNTVNADQFQFSFSIFVLAMVILGGLGSIWGVVVGAIVLSVINNYLIPDVFNEPAQQGRPELRPDRAVVRHLRLPAGDHDDPAAGGADPRTAAQDGAGGRHRRRRRRLRIETAVSEILLEASGVTKRFGGLTAVDDVTFSIPERSIVSIIGPNGAGKTTFFNILTGLYKPTLGRIDVRGRQHHLGPARQDHEARDRADVPEHPPLRHDVRAGERHDRPAQPHEGGPVRLDLPHAASAQGGAARARARGGGARVRRHPPPRCTTSSPSTSPTATSDASRSRARSHPTPSCCSSTSRRPG